MILLPIKIEFLMVTTTTKTTLKQEIDNCRPSPTLLHDDNLEEEEEIETTIETSIAEETTLKTEIVLEMDLKN